MTYKRAATVSSTGRILCLDLMRSCAVPRISERYLDLVLGPACCLVRRLLLDSSVWALMHGLGAQIEGLALLQA